MLNNIIPTMHRVHLTVFMSTTDITLYLDQPFQIVL